jgi:hypothetical protein
MHDGVARTKRRRKRSKRNDPYHPQPASQAKAVPTPAASESSTPRRSYCRTRLSLRRSANCWAARAVRDCRSGARRPVPSSRARQRGDNQIHRARVLEVSELSVPGRRSGRPFADPIATALRRTDIRLLSRSHLTVRALIERCQSDKAQLDDSAIGLPATVGPPL